MTGVVARASRARWVGGVLSLTTTLTLTSCSVPAAGLAGVGVDANGRLVGYLAICHDAVDGATLYYDRQSAGPADTPAPTGGSVEVGAWHSAVRVTGTVSWSLSAPDRGWTTLTPLATLVPNREYTLYGWTDDNSWSATHVSFKPAELARLRPGQVLHLADREPPPTMSDDVYDVSSVAGFTEAACNQHPS